MKTLKSLTAALLIFIAFSAMADDSKGTPVVKRNIPAPAFTWGSPEDLNTRTVEQLKYLPVIAPAMVWGSPEDLNEADLEVLKVRDNAYVAFPAFNWGSPDDLEEETLESLKTAAHMIRYPAVVIGNPDEIDASDLK